MRTQRIQQMMQEKEIDAAIIASNANWLYFAGSIPSGYLYIPREGEAVAFLRRPCAGLDGVAVYKPEQMPGLLAERGYGMPETLLLEEESISASEYLRLAGVFPQAKVQKGSGLIRALRAVKEQDELDMLIETAKMHAALYEKIPSLFTPGMTDARLSAEMEYQARLLGHLGIFRMFGMKMEIFMGSILAGDNAGSVSPYDFALGGRGVHPSLPIGADGTAIEGNMTVMVDMSANLYGYLTDMTRTYAVGTLPDEMYRAHQVSIEIQQAIAAAAVPGATGGELYQIALELVKKNGLEAHFMGYGQQAKFVGHGLGIEINELPVLAPRSAMPLQENMAIALEPKFVFPQYGAAGTENTYIVRKNGLEKITLFEEEIIRLD